MVKFTRSYGPYNIGEVAAFRQETERDFIKRRIAVAHTKEESGEKKPEEKKSEERKPEEPKTRQTVVGPQRR